MSTVRRSHQAGSFLKEISAIVRVTCQNPLSQEVKTREGSTRQRLLCSGASVSDSAEEDPVADLLSVCSWRVTARTLDVVEGVLTHPGLWLVASPREQLALLVALFPEPTLDFSHMAAQFLSMGGLRVVDSCMDGGAPSLLLAAGGPAARALWMGFGVEHISFNRSS